MHFHVHANTKDPCRNSGVSTRNPEVNSHGAFKELIRSGLCRYRYLLSVPNCHLNDSSENPDPAFLGGLSFYVVVFINHRDSNRQ